MDNPIKKEKQRTKRQNDSLHKYFELVSDALRDAGFTVQRILKMRMELEFTPLLVKEVLWREAQIGSLGKKSTTELTSREVDQVYDEVNRFLAENCNGIHVPFPSNEIYREEE